MHPIEKTEELVHEAEEGKTARTPWLLITGVNAIVFGIVAVVLAIVFTVYLLA